ncbi:MAG: hypothetical protein WAV90_13855 [Gordonia amarae]
MATVGAAVELMARLKRHYIKPGAPMPGGVFLPEVGQNGSWGSGSRCDAIYVGFTSTSGRILVGHELKVSRGDWLAELNKPGKADTWADECHEWWLVVSDPAIVADGELPAGWGLMSPGPSKTRMKVIVKPDRKPADHAPSWQAVRSIMARQDTLRASAINDVRARAAHDARSEQKKRVDDEVARRMGACPDVEVLRDRLVRIESALGCAIDWSDHGWRWPGAVTLDDLAAIGAAARTYGSINRGVDELTQGYRIDGIRRDLDALSESLASLRSVRDQHAVPAEAEGAA